MHIHWRFPLAPVRGIPVLTTAYIQETESSLQVRERTQCKQLLAVRVVPCLFHIFLENELGLILRFPADISSAMWLKTGESKYENGAFTIDLVDAVIVVATRDGRIWTVKPFNLIADNCNNNMSIDNKEEVQHETIASMTQFIVGDVVVDVPLKCCISKRAGTHSFASASLPSAAFEPSECIVLMSSFLCSTMVWKIPDITLGARDINLSDTSHEKLELPSLDGSLSSSSLCIRSSQSSHSSNSENPVQSMGTQYCKGWSTAFEVRDDLIANIFGIDSPLRFSIIALQGDFEGVVKWCEISTKSLTSGLQSGILNISFEEPVIRIIPISIEKKCNDINDNELSCLIFVGKLGKIIIRGMRKSTKTSEERKSTKTSEKRKNSLNNEINSYEYFQHTTRVPGPIQSVNICINDENSLILVHCTADGVLYATNLLENKNSNFRVGRTIKRHGNGNIVLTQFDVLSQVIETSASIKLLVSNITQHKNKNVVALTSSGQLISFGLPKINQNIMKDFVPLTRSDTKKRVVDKKNENENCFDTCDDESSEYSSSSDDEEDRGIWPRSKISYKNLDSSFETVDIEAIGDSDTASLEIKRLLNRISSISEAQNMTASNAIIKNMQILAITEAVHVLSALRRIIPSKRRIPYFSHISSKKQVGCVSIGYCCQTVLREHSSPGLQRIFRVSLKDPPRMCGNFVDWTIIVRFQQQETDSTKNMDKLEIELPSPSKSRKHGSTSYNSKSTDFLPLRIETISARVPPPDVQSSKSIHNKSQPWHWDVVLPMTSDTPIKIETWISAQDKSSKKMKCSNSVNTFTTNNTNANSHSINVFDNNTIEWFNGIRCNANKSSKNNPGVYSALLGIGVVDILSFCIPAPPSVLEHTLKTQGNKNSSRKQSSNLSWSRQFLKSKDTLPLYGSTPNSSSQDNVFMGNSCSLRISIPSSSKQSALQILLGLETNKWGWCGQGVAVSRLRCGATVTLTSSRDIPGTQNHSSQSISCVLRIEVAKEYSQCLPLLREAILRRVSEQNLHEFSGISNIGRNMDGNDNNINQNVSDNDNSNSLNIHQKFATFASHIQHEQWSQLLVAHEQLDELVQLRNEYSASQKLSLLQLSEKSKEMASRLCKIYGNTRELMSHSNIC